MNVLDTGALTEFLIDLMQDALGRGSKDPLVGDSDVPLEGGWVEGQPGVEAFRPYAVLACTGGVPRIPAGLKNVYPNMWAMGFSIRYYGGSRRQVDAIAKTGRSTIAGIQGEEFDATEWRVKNLEWVNHGPVLPNRATAPPSRQILDTITVVVGS